MTAEEFIKDAQQNPGKGWTARKMLIEFAKYHVKKALEAASEKATMKIEYPDEAYAESNEYGETCVSASDIERGGEDGIVEIEKESILEAYPESNIK